MKTSILILAFGLIGNTIFATNTFTLACDSVKKTEKKINITKAKKEAKLKSNPTIDKTIEVIPETTTQTQSSPQRNPLPIAPTYKDGQLALEEFIKTNLVLPEAFKKSKQTLKVDVSFVVGTDGKLKDIKVIKPVGMGCDEEALRIIKKMPNWNPGKVGRTLTEMPFAIGIEFKN